MYKRKFDETARTHLHRRLWSTRHCAHIALLEGQESDCHFRLKNLLAIAHLFGWMGENAGAGAKRDEFGVGCNIGDYVVELLLGKAVGGMGTGIE
jgi:hypothetical protein